MPSKLGVPNLGRVWELVWLAYPAVRRQYVHLKSKKEPISIDSGSALMMHVEENIGTRKNETTVTSTAITNAVAITKCQRDLTIA